MSSPASVMDGASMTPELCRSKGGEAYASHEFTSAGEKREKKTLLAVCAVCAICAVLLYAVCCVLCAMCCVLCAVLCAVSYY